MEAEARFCWTELSTTDGDRAKRFYARLFGWDSTPQPVRSRIGQSIDYALLCLRGLNVGGLCPMSGGQRKRGAQSHWLSYVFVEDVDSIAARARELGAALLAGPLTVFDLGRLSILRDPQGALFGAWQPIRLGRGFQMRDEPGFACWFEHVSADVDQAARFYGSLFGWSPRPLERGRRIVLEDGGAGVAGLSSSARLAGSLASQWVTFFQVADLDATCEKLASLHGAVVVPPEVTPDSIRYVVARDPLGATFGLLATAAVAR